MKVATSFKMIENGKGDGIVQENHTLVALQIPGPFF